MTGSSEDDPVAAVPEEPDRPVQEHAPGGGEGLWKRHGVYTLSVFLLVLILAWLTFDGAHPDMLLLILVVLIAAVYRFLVTTARLSARARENLVFASLAMGLITLLGVLSGWSTQHMVFILTPVVFFAIFALGLNLEFGYTGIINFGHVAFMAIGAYTMALLSVPLLEHASVLMEPGAPTLVVIGIAGLSGFVLTGVFASILVEVVMRRKARRDRVAGTGPHGGSVQGDPRRLTMVVGLVAGVSAAALVVWVIPYPMTPMWAMASIVFIASFAGMALAAFAGVLLGLPTLRLRADYLAIVTIGAAEILRRAVRNEQWLTGGPTGVRQLPRPFGRAGEEWTWLQHAAGALGVTEYRLLLFLMALGALLLVLMVYAVLLRSPYGRVLRAIREDEDVPAALGKNVFMYKLQIFAIGSAVAALAGSFLAWHRAFISPESFIPLITFYAWIIIVIGGIGNNKGAVLGAVVLFSFFEITRALNLDENLGLTTAQGSALRVVLIGVLLILLMLFKPEGLLGKREELVLGD